MQPYTFFDHTADIKFQAYGKNLEDAFINAAYAVTSLLTEDDIAQKKVKSITVQGNDLKALLYNFLEEFLYLLDAEFFLLSTIESLKINRVNREYMLTALLKGDVLDGQYETKSHIKAVTYNEMEIKEEKDHCMVQVVLDH